MKKFVGMQIEFLLEYYMISNYVFVLYFQLISECHNAYDYYGESDAETCLNDESLDAPDSGDSQSSVIMSEVFV